MLIVASYTHRHLQVDQLTVAARLPDEVLSSVVGGDDENVAFVAPLDEHHSIVIPPFSRLALPQLYITQCVRNFPASRTNRPTEIRVRLQQVCGQIDGRKEVVRVEVVTLRQVARRSSPNLLRLSHDVHTI